MGKIRFECAGRRELSFLVGQERRNSHFGARGMLFIGILFVFHALALGLRRREGFVSKGPVASAGGISSTVGERILERLSPALTKREGSFPCNVV